MHIHSEEYRLEWEKGLIQAEQEESVSAKDQDKENTLRKLRELYVLAYNQLIRMGHTTESVQAMLDKVSLS